jgi:hypothetical protein
MDELEISGKRYISARRAGKEYGYHSDYIGQLVRSKKLLGQKVGRSWYVELGSLTEYFGNNGVAIERAPLVAKSVAEAPAPKEAAREKEAAAPPARAAQSAVAEAPAATPVQPAADAAEAAQKLETTDDAISDYDASSDAEIKSAARDSIHIPVRVRRPSFEEGAAKKASPLRYVSDDEPYVPAISKAERASLATTTVMPRIAQEAREAEDVEQERARYEAPQKKSRGIKSAFSIAAIGAIALVLVMGSSILVSSHMVIEAGKTASVGFSLH